MTWSGSGSSSEDAPTRGDAVSPGAALRGDGYPVNYGSSFVMVVDYSNGTTEASAILTYGQTGLREAGIFSSQTARFSEKDWRTIAFTEEQISDDPSLTSVLVSQP
ncbi:MAG: acyl-homoserine-lactone acylase [Ilumatobacter sp.]